MEAAAKDIGLPDLAGIPLELLEQIVHHILGLLFVAHNGRDRRLDVRPDHMDAGGAGLEPDAVASALLHDLRLLQLQLVDSGHHDAVSRFADILQRSGYLVVLRFDGCQPGQKTHEIAIVGHGESRLLRKRMVEQFAGQYQCGAGNAGSQINGGNFCLTDVFAFA